MDLNSIKPLDEFPKTPYQREVAATALKFRWIHAQCFQVKLPGGKVLMTDPFFPQHPKAWKMDNTPLLDVEKLGRVDYVTINHSHFDHTANLPDLFKDSSPLVICDRMYARELSAAFGIQEFNICPIVPGMSYQFEDFRLDTVQGKHGSLGMVCDPSGKLFEEPDSPYMGQLNSYGSLFNTNFLFTLANNFRMGFAAGVDYGFTREAWRNQGPDLLLLQRMRKERPEEYVKKCEMLHGQLVVPMHQDACCEETQDMNLYAEHVNQIFAENRTEMSMFHPQRLKWYKIKTQIELNEE